MEVFFVVFHTSPLVLVGDFMLRKEPRNTEAPHINIQSPKMTSQYIKFSHKKKYCGIKDIRVLFYSSIFQMVIVFLFIVLKYISFCCHSYHSVLCCNRLVYSCFILIVKSDSNFNLNFSCYLSILFNLFVTHLCLQLVFSFLYPYFSYFRLYFVLCILSFLLLCLFYYFVFLHSVFPVILSFFLFCLSSFCFSCYSVFLLILSFFLFCLYVILSLVILSLFIFLSHLLFSILASFLPFHLFIF